MVEYDKKQYNKCAADRNIGSRLFVAVWVLVSEPGECDKQEDVKVEKCLKCIDRPHSVHSDTNKLFKTSNTAYCEDNRSKSNSGVIGNIDSSYKVQD